MEPQSKNQLSLVKDEADLEGYEPRLIATQELVNRFWPSVAPILRGCVSDAPAMGASDLEHIRVDILNGEKQLFVVHNELDVKLAIVTELSEYGYEAMLTIVALGGEQLTLFKSKFWTAFKHWAYVNGVRTIEADVSPAMERVVKAYGFERESVRVRMPLTGE